MPLTAMFILFDFVVHNPHHSETKTNLLLLDVLAGYFSLLAYRSQSMPPGTVPSDFAQIARDYVQAAQKTQSKIQAVITTTTTNSSPFTSSSECVIPHVASTPTTQDDSVRSNTESV